MSELDDDLDSYFGNKDAPSAVREKKQGQKAAVDKGSLDDDLDSYFAAKKEGGGGGAGSDE